MTGQRRVGYFSILTSNSRENVTMLTANVTLDNSQLGLENELHAVQ